MMIHKCLHNWVRRALDWAQGVGYLDRRTRGHRLGNGVTRASTYALTLRTSTAHEKSVEHVAELDQPQPFIAQPLLVNAQPQPFSAQSQPLKSSPQPVTRDPLREPLPREPLPREPLRREPLPSERSLSRSATSLLTAQPEPL